MRICKLFVYAMLPAKPFVHRERDATLRRAESPYAVLPTHAFCLSKGFAVWRRTNTPVTMEPAEPPCMRVRIAPYGGAESCGAVLSA